MRNARGFSVVELLVGTAILLAVTAGVFTMLNDALRRSPAWNDAADVQQRARVATEAIASRIRGARTLDLRATSITVSPAADPATGMADPDETIYFDSASGIIRRASGGGDFPLVDAVEDLRFEYVGEGTARRVRATVRLRSPLAGGLTIALDVAPRNGAS